MSSLLRCDLSRTYTVCLSCSVRSCLPSCSGTPLPLRTAHFRSKCCTPSCILIRLSAPWKVSLLGLKESHLMHMQPSSLPRIHAEQSHRRLKCSICTAFPILMHEFKMLQQSTLLFNPHLQKTGLLSLHHTVLWKQILLGVPPLWRKQNVLQVLF